MKASKGFTRRRIRALTSFARNERLSLSGDSPTHFILSTSCRFRTRKLLAAGVSPFVSVNFGIWLRKKSGFVVAFDAGRRLSGVGVSLLSHATTGIPSSIQNVKFDKDDFLQLKDWILLGELGQIKRITMHDIKKDDTQFKQIVLSSNRLQDSSLFNDLLDMTSAIANLTFNTPRLESSGRSLSCRLNYWGGLTIYSPSLLESELSELIGSLEKTIGKS